LYCIHCILPKHDPNNEISLELGYARAHYLFHNYSIVHLDDQDRRELVDIESRIENDSAQPLSIPACLLRYLEIVGRESIFKVRQNEVVHDFVISDVGVRVREPGSFSAIIADWPLPDVYALNPTDEGLAVQIKINGELTSVYFETSESNEMVTTFLSTVYMLMYKNEKNPRKRKFLPVHDMFHSVAQKDAPQQADRIVQMINEGYLEWLDLSWSSIRGNDLKKILAALVADTCVRHVDLSGYTGGINDIRAILDVIKRSNIVTTINLSYCSLGDEITDKLAEFFTENKSLKAINLILNGFGPQGINTILNGLKTNTSIRAVSVSLPNIKLSKNAFWLERSYYLRELSN